jgi:hypothetical protein
LGLSSLKRRKYLVSSKLLISTSEKARLSRGSPTDCRLKVIVIGLGVGSWELEVFECLEMNVGSEMIWFCNFRDQQVTFLTFP